MKYISKNITPEAADALQTFIRLEKEKAHYDNFKQSDGKDKVQKSLLEEQGYLCAYCMQRIEHPHFCGMRVSGFTKALKN
jgi:hypothetical protein